MFEVVKTGLLPSPAPVNGTVKSGNMIYSVQVPRDQTTGKTAVGDIKVQMRQTLANLKQAVEAGGGSLADVSKLRTRYIAALQAADGYDIGPLLAFARS